MTGAAKPKKRENTRANGDVTKVKLLNAAEILFAEHGYDAVSLRDITRLADVTLALASYHFQVKENLFSSVVARRAEAIGELRLKQLEENRSKGILDTNSILDAFIRPVFDQVQGGDPNWVAYIQLLPRIAENRRWSYLLAEHFNKTADTFISELRQVLPNHSEEQLLRGFSFALHLMLQSLSPHQRVETLSGGQFSSSDFDKSYPMLLRFCVAGIENLADPKSKY